MRSLIPMTVITRVPRYKRLLSYIVLRLFALAPLREVQALHFILFARWTYVKRRSAAFAKQYGSDYPSDFLMFVTNYSGRFNPYIDAFESTATPA